MIEYIIIGLIVLGAGCFLFRYFRKTVKSGICSDCAQHCGQKAKEKCRQDSTKSGKET